MSDWILSLDASTPTTVVTVGRMHEQRPTAQITAVAQANQTSERLTAHIQSCLRDAGVSMSELSQIACGVGPGTFTGTRVTVALTKGIALGLGIPVVPVSTLEALALRLPTAQRRRGVCMALLDARRGEVYGARYGFIDSSDQLETLTAPRCLPLSDLLSTSPAPQTAVGTGIVPYETEFHAYPDCEVVPTEGLDAQGLWRASLASLASGHAMSAAQVRVHYLRASYAEMGIHAPKKPMVKSPFV